MINTYEIQERFHWRLPSGAIWAINQVAPAGSVKESSGFRIIRNGSILYPSQLPFETRESAQAALDCLVYLDTEKAMLLG